MIFLATLAVAQGVYEISEKKRLTTDSHYDRNPSFFKAQDGTWWLFFVRNRDGDPNYGNACEGKGCDEDGCNCDSAQYDVYYMKSTNEGETWLGPIKLTACSTGQRGMAAFQDSTGKIWVFVSGPGDRTIRYCTSNDDGTTWNGPTDTEFSGSHVDAFQANDGKIYIFYESHGVQYAYFDGTSWTSGTVDGINGMGIPKCIQDSTGRFYCVYVIWPQSKYYYSISNDGVTWENKGVLTDVPNTIGCDPVMYQDSDGLYWLFYAPWDSDDNSQWIEYRTSTNGRTWSAPTGLTTGGYKDEYWWDMWPEVTEGSGIIVFYTSEQTDDGTGRKDGDIWMLKLEDKTKTIEEEIDQIKSDNQDQWNIINQLNGNLQDIEGWKINIANEISAIWTKLKEIQDFMKTVIDCAYSTFSPFHQCLVGQGPELWEIHCGNGICETEKGETPTSCPQDCVGLVDHKVFIGQGWKLTCPETFTTGEVTYNIDHCVVELYLQNRYISNRTIEVGKTYKVNYNAGFSIKMYGIPISVPE